MGLGGILLILVILISLVLFIIFLVKSARDWGALQAVFLSILFIESWVFVVFSAGVHNTRVKDTVDASQQSQKLKKASADLEIRRYGSASDPEDKLEAVVPVQGKLDRLTIDRGRVWRQAVYVGQVQGKDQFQLNLQSAPAAPADPNNPNAAQPVAAPASRTLPVNMVVYGFQEQLSSEGYPLPVFYLGEYKVVVSDEATGLVTLEPTRAMLPLHLERIKQGLESWTLYELLPIDSHHAFVAEGSSASDEMIFGKPDEDKIKELLANSPAEVVDAYINDGQKARDNDPPETLWALISLIKSLKSDVDSPENADAGQSSYFDSLGRAVDERLRKGEEVTLDPSNLKDDRIVVIDSEAKKLIGDGTAKLVSPVFVRPLNDYEELFNNHARREYELAERIKYYQHQTSLINAANQDGQNMLTEQQKENQLLDADLGNYKKEIDVLNSAVAEANAELDMLKKELSRLYQEIQGRREKLVSTIR